MIGAPDLLLSRFEIPRQGEPLASLRSSRLLVGFVAFLAGFHVLFCSYLRRTSGRYFHVHLAASVTITPYLQLVDPAAR